MRHTVSIADFEKFHIEETLASDSRAGKKLRVFVFPTKGLTEYVVHVGSKFQTFATLGQAIDLCNRL